MVSRRYLVTGGSGFIGSALVRLLLHQGHSVRVIDNNSRGSLRRLNDVLGDIEFIEQDIRDSEGVRKTCAGMDAVCHLAYINGTEYFYSKPALVLEVGVKGMLNVLDGCLAEGIRELILLSSSEVYQTPPIIPTPETVPLVVPDPLQARYSYGGGKIISELLAVNYGRTDFDKVLIVRPHNVYGPDMGNEHVVPQFVSRMLELRDGHQGGQISFPIQGSGQETRAFNYIDDFITGMEIVLGKGEHLGIYNVGTDQETTVRELAQEVARAMELRIELVPGPLTPGSTSRRCPDIGKIRALGYQPRVSLSEGIDRFTQWFLDRKDTPSYE